MNIEVINEIERCKTQICDAFSALEFAYRNFDGSNDCGAVDIVAIIGVSTHSGMIAFENLSNALDKLISIESNH